MLYTLHTFDEANRKTPIAIYNLINDCTIAQIRISNTIITNNMLLHVSTFKMSSSGSSLCLAKITYRFSGLSKMKLLKYEMINFNKMLIVQRNKKFAGAADVVAVSVRCLLRADTATTAAALAYTATTQNFYHAARSTFY